MKKQNQSIVICIFCILFFLLGILIGMYSMKDAKKEALPLQRAEETIIEAPVFNQESDKDDDTVAAASQQERILSTTKLLLQETDLLRGNVVETEWEMPSKYWGMDCISFHKAMEIYSKSAPLEELERGFRSAYVISFSPKQVVVQMNYKYVQPGSAFYACLLDGELVIFLEDKTTIYLNTGISEGALTEEMLGKMIEGYRISGEKELYGFLESLTS